MPPKSSAGADKVYHTGDVVLAKVKGYPSWPGQIIEPDLAPPNVKKERSKSKATYLVRFFPTGDYAWTAARDLSSLSTREIETYVSSPAKKSGDLLTAYKIARDPTEWQRQRDEAQAEYDELQAAALYEQQQGEDQLESAEEGEESGAKKGKKRKSESGKGVVEDKKSKKAKLAQLAKSRAGAGASKKSGYSDEEPERPVKKSKPVDDNDDPGLKQVKDWRHKLQKVFIGKTPPSSQDMPKCKEYFDDMESFEMNKDWLAESKLAKVLKRICLLKETEIPDGDRFNFRQRSAALALKWTQANGGAAVAGTPVPGDLAPPSNAEPSPAAPPVGAGEEKPASTTADSNGVGAPMEGVTSEAVVEEAKVESVPESAPAPIAAA